MKVEYKYDARGRPLGTSGSIAETLGRRNPFRYRGYVYDEESGLYYLRSRYYDPELGRFLNSDTLIDKDTKSLFAYCLNNPVIYADTNGRLYTLVINLESGIKR